MKINIISDLHCSYDFKENAVIWNQEFSITRKCIEKFNHILEIFNSNRDKYSSLHNSKIEFNDIVKHLNYFLQICKEKPKQLSHEQYTDISNKIHDIKSCIYEEMESSDPDISSIYIKLSNALSTFHIQIEQIYSHFDPSKLKPADYLIICGDLGLDDCYEKVYQDIKEKTKDIFKDVFYVKGNHDYWWFYNANTPNKPDSINLDHRYVEEVIGDYVFLGCTMWSPIYNERYCVSRYMNDYRYIPHYSIDKCNDLHNQESAWLRDKVHYYKSLNKKVIVFTHHIPRKELLNPKYKHSDVNEAYYVMDGSCDDIKPDVWCTGHAHTYHNTVIDDILFVCNPIGYRSHYGYLPSEVSPIHWYDTIIEI
jgi:predicted phosphodiesterase